MKGGRWGVICCYLKGGGGNLLLLEGREVGGNLLATKLSWDKLSGNKLSGNKLSGNIKAIYHVYCNLYSSALFLIISILLVRVRFPDFLSKFYFHGFPDPKGTLVHLKIISIFESPTPKLNPIQI